MESLNTYDLVFQGEKNFTGANIGFMAFNCNQAVLGFWKEVLLNIEKERVWDQKIVNMLIMESKVSWGYFPKEIWNWTMPGKWNSIALHHAVGTSDLNLKLFQMKIVRIVYNLKWLNNFDIMYRYSRKMFTFSQIIFRYFKTQKND